MRKALIAGFTRFRQTGKGNYFIIGGNVFSFNTKQNSFFKRKEVAVPQILKEEDVKYQTQQLQPLQPQNKEKLKDLLINYQHYFTKQRHNLPFFLQKLSKSLNQKISAKEINKLQDIYNKLNNYSSELSLKSVQYLQILIFIEKYMQLSLKQLSIKPIMANNGFEHRATMMTATFLLNNSLTMAQAITLFKIFTSIGSISSLFLANFTKYLKSQFQNDRSKNNIKLQHLLAILSQYFLKNNRTILENVLYDMTLLHLLSNPQLIQSSSSTSLHVQVLTYLLRIDLKYFYMSQQRQLVNGLKILTQKIMLLYRNTKTNNFNHYYSIYLLESCDYYIASKNNNPEILALVQEIVSLVHKKIRMNKFILNLKDCELCRLFYSRRLFEMNTNHTQIIKKIAEEIEDEKSVYPLIDRFYDSDQERATELLREIYQRKSSVFLPAISKIMLSISTTEEIATFWKEIIENKNAFMKNHIFLYSLLFYSKHKCPQLLEHQQIQKLHKKLRQKMLKLSQDKYTFIHSLFDAINLYRDINSCSSWLTEVINQINLQDYIEVTHSKQAEYQNHQVRLISITALALSYQPLLAIPAKFNDHSMYVYLRSLYPLSHPTQTYTKHIHFLQLDESFKRNMEILVQLTRNFQKYSYLLWDIFINNYIQKSQNVRAACFDLLKSLFSKAFEKETARRIVLLSNLTNYLSSQIIIASQSQIKHFFQSFLRPLVDDKIHEKFHYHCFLQITFNALSLGILTKQSFTKIINRCLAADKCVPSSYKTSSLLILYGMTMKNSGNGYSEFYFQQRRYIKYLLDNNLVKITNESLSKDQQQKLQKSNRRYVIAGSKFLCILLQYGEHQILNISEEILNFVRSNHYFSEILQLHSSFNPQLYDLKDKNLLKFARSLNNTLEQKINSFYMQKLIRKETHSEVASKLIKNTNLIKLFIQ